MHIRRSHKLMAALAVASGALVACNLITGLNADYSAGAHDGAVAPVGEGGGGDGPGADGQGGDGSTTDGMTTLDGGDAATTFACDQLKGDSGPDDFFCTDFEGESPGIKNQPPTGWSDLVNVRDAGTFSIVMANGSQALDVTSSSDGTSGAHTRLRKLFSPADAFTYLHYELEFKFYVQSSNLQYAGLGFVAFAATDTTGKEHGVAQYGPDSVVLSHQGGSSVMKLLADTGVWHQARVTLDRATADATYTRTITIDSTDVDDSPAGQVIASGDPTELWLGIFLGAKAFGQAHVQFDNVVFRRRQ